MVIAVGEFPDLRLIIEVPHEKPGYAGFQRIEQKSVDRGYHNKQYDEEKDTSDHKCKYSYSSDRIPKLNQKIRESHGNRIGVVGTYYVTRI